MDYATFPYILPYCNRNTKTILRWNIVMINMNQNKESIIDIMII